MSNPNTAEEVFSKKIKETHKYHLNDTLYGFSEKEKEERGLSFKEGFRQGWKASQEHTTQALDRLKGRVGEIEKESELLQGIWEDEFNRGVNDTCKKLLQLIEEISDE